MSTHELENKVRELRQLQALIDEAQAEADAIRDAIKAHMGDSEELQAGEYRITWNQHRDGYTQQLPHVQYRLRMPFHSITRGQKMKGENYAYDHQTGRNLPHPGILRL